MAASMQSDEEAIVGINVTPLVDIVLVLLVILMVTASYVASQAIPLELPRAATGETAAAVLSVSIDAGGQLFVDGAKVDEAGLRAVVRAAVARDAQLTASIAADGRARHAQVIWALDVLRQEQVTRFALDVDPPEAAP